MNNLLLNFLLVFLGIFILQICFFLYAAINKTDKVTDLSYGITFIVGALVGFFLESNPVSAFKILLLCLISTWGIRLSAYLFLRILKTGKDKRFDGIRENTKKFGSFWLLQAISIFIILLPTTYILLQKTVMTFNLLSLIGFLIAFLGILIEGIADNQKFVFKNNSKNKDRWIDTGLWKYSRHPNYLGEIMMWIGVFLLSTPYINGFAWLTILSPIYISILLLFISGIPTLEKKTDEKFNDNPEYYKYKEKTGILLPKLFIKKS